MFPGFLILRLLILDLHLRLGRSESHYGMIAGNKYLRRTLFLCARVAKNYGSFKEFYNRLVERGKKTVVATCALAGKLTTKAYHVLRDCVYEVKSSFEEPKEVKFDKPDIKGALDSLYS